MTVGIELAPGARLTVILAYRVKKLVIFDKSVPMPTYVRRGSDPLLLKYFAR